MAAFVLLWNPSNFDWPSDDLADAVATTARGEIRRSEWSTGVRSSGISVGDRAYLFRQGHSHRGLLAVGRFASAVFWSEHWDGSGRDAAFANIDFERVLAPTDSLGIEALLQGVGEISWNSLRGGGVDVSDHEASIEDLWSEHIAALDGSSSPKRNPPWSWDEIVLALDLYFRIGVQSSTHPEVINLSEILNRLPIHAIRPQAARFRNPNGVNLKLANLAHFDPSYGGAGMARGSTRDREVFETYNGRREELNKVASEIRALAMTGRAREIPEPDEEEVDATEGRLLYRRHRSRERDPGIVALRG